MENTTTMEKIEHAALDAFAEFGYHATSMRVIASETGVKAASLYHWYPSKQALLVAITKRYLKGLYREVALAIEQHSSPTQRFAAAVWTHVVYEGSHQRAAFVTDTEIRALTGEGRQEILALRDGYERIFEHLIRDGVVAGDFESREPRIATFAILLQCTGVSVWFRPDGRLTLPEVADLHVELVLNSLRAKHIPRRPLSDDGAGRIAESLAVQHASTP